MVAGGIVPCLNSREEIKIVGRYAVTQCRCAILTNRPTIPQTKLLVCGLGLGLVILVLVLITWPCLHIHWSIYYTSVSTADVMHSALNVCGGYNLQL